MVIKKEEISGHYSELVNLDIRKCYRTFTPWGSQDEKNLEILGTKKAFSFMTPVFPIQSTNELKLIVKKENDYQHN